MSKDQNSDQFVKKNNSEFGNKNERNVKSFNESRNIESIDL